MEDFFGEILWDKLLTKELMFLSRFLGNFVSMEGRKKEGRILILRSATQAHRT